MSDNRASSLLALENADPTRHAGAIEPGARPLGQKHPM
jgi:hypothetical protein